MTNSISQLILLRLSILFTLSSCFNPNYERLAKSTSNPIICNRYEILPVDGSYYVAEVGLYTHKNRDFDEICMLADGWQAVPGDSYHIFRFTKPKAAKCPP